VAETSDLHGRTGSKQGVAGQDRESKFGSLSLLIVVDTVKGIVHLEINFWYVLAYLKGIQDVGVFVSTVVLILIFLGQTVCLSVI